MTLKHVLSAAIIGTSITLVQFYSQTASALTAPEVGKIAKQITVRIESQAEGRKKQGSGFIIKKSDDKYYVVTAHHVVADEAKYSLIAPDKERYTLDKQKITYKSGTDLAVVEFSSNQTYQIAKTGNSDDASEGTTVYVAGFPASTSVVNTSELYRFLKGEISANASQPLDEGYSLVYTNPTLRGMSGGPVLNEKGEVIAIHGRAETQPQPTTDGIKALGTGNNLGISVNTFLRLALLDTGVKAPPLQVAKALKADDFYLQGVDKYTQRDYQGAIERFTKAIEINSKYANAYIGRGFVYDGLKQHDKALADYNRVLEIDDRNAIAYSNRGKVYDDLKQPDKALADYNRAIKLDSQNAIAYYNRGNNYYGRKQYYKAITDYNKTLKINPGFAFAYSNRGTVYKKLKQYDKALKDYNSALEIDNRDAITYSNRGVVYYELKTVEAAIKDWKNAIFFYNLYPDPPQLVPQVPMLRFPNSLNKFPELQLAIAVALYQQGNLQESLKLGSEALSSDKRLTNLQFMKERLEWGDLLLRDTENFFKEPQIRSLLN